MLSNGFFKRFLPFFVTFAVGMLIASFFVDLSGRRFGKGHHGGRCQQMIELRDRVNQLEVENRELRLQLGSSSVTSEINVIGSVPAPPIAPVAPVVPLAPARHNHK